MADQPENRIDDTLLGKYLAGEADPAESERVQRWLSQNGSERQELERFQRIWQTAGQLNKQAGPAPVDTDAAWKKMQSQMAKRPAVGPEQLSSPQSVSPEPAEPLMRPMPTTSRRTDWTMYWRVAAAVVLLSGMLWFFWQETRSQTGSATPQLAVASTKGKIEKVLPDGTRVLLNENSRLSYPQAFGADSREVTLVGEAFFEVMPDPARPFRIHAKHTTVQVLGTSFSVRAYTENVRVAVRTGKVKFTAKDKKITLVKNEQASFDAEKDTLVKAPKLDLNLLAFKTGQLEFKDERLEDVLKTINEFYHADVRLANKRLGNCPLNTRFEDASFDYVLGVTTETLGLRIVKREGNHVLLDGQSCQ